MNYISMGIVHITFSAVELTISTFFAGISVLLSSFEDISSRLFERASDFSGVPPRASFPTEKCAILILGAQEGVGRNAALRFSELGYTVFALCPNRHEDSGHSLSSGKSTDVASLLYTWHNRKERSRSIPWGLVAPMQLNLWSRPQREVVRETVRAHCSAYDLHLVALVISHDSKPLRDALPSFVDVLDATDSPDVLCEEDAWRNSVLDEVTEPVLMARDYKNLLAEASGRVIILSNFTDGSPLTLLSLASRTAAAENLAELLESQGIRVSSIYFGPLAQCSRGPSSGSQSIDSRRLWQSLEDWQESFDILRQKVSRQLIVQDSLLFTILQRVVQSRHPKFVYTVGVYPHLQRALRLAPVDSRFVVKSFIRWVMSPER